MQAEQSRTGATGVDRGERTPVGVLGILCIVAMLTAAVGVGGFADTIRGVANSAGGTSEFADVVTATDELMNKAIVVAAIMCPLGMAGGAISLIFGGRHGPQVMGAAVVGVLLTIACKGVAA
jgi:hypothetical protein